MMKEDVLGVLRRQRSFLRGLRALGALYGFRDGFDADAARMDFAMSFAAGVPFVARCSESAGGLSFDVALGPPGSSVRLGFGADGEVGYSVDDSPEVSDVPANILRSAFPVGLDGRSGVALMFATVIPALVRSMAEGDAPSFDDEASVSIFVLSGGRLTVRGRDLAASDEEDADLSPEDELPLAPSAFAGKSRYKVFDPSERAPVKRKSMDSESDDDEFFSPGDDGYRSLLPFGRSRALEVAGLREMAPHFGVLWDEVSSMASAAAIAGVPLRLDPVLILGPPGIGKTWAINRMRDVLGLEGEIFSMAGTSLNEGVQGGHPSWKGASPGLVAKIFAKSQTANPLVCVDEFDKITTHQWRGDAYAPYYALLEPEGSTTFVDEFLSVHFDTRHVSWLFTANDVRAMPEMILDRVKVIEVERPDRDQMRRMARAMTALAHVRYGDWFSGFEPGEDLLDALSGLSPRRSVLAYSSAMASAVAGRRHSVGIGDLPVRRREKRAGFLS